MSTPLPLLLLAAAAVLAHAQPSYDDPAAADRNTAINPSVAITVGVFTIVFSLTLLLLVYAKFVHSGGQLAGPADDVFLSLEGPARCASGIDRSVVESLPFFRFSALGGRRDGLECAVCLSRFDGTDVLRLLPKCKHAFHVGCVDRWLESHSTCPLCRHRIEPDDSSTYDDDSNVLEVLVEREREPSSNGLLHKHEHKITVSGAMFRGRWSELNSSDLVSLDAEMLRASGLLLPRSKCASEIRSVSRFRAGARGDDDDDEDRIRRLWLPMAQRTVQLFAGRVKNTTGVAIV